ncbi:MAG: Rpn family recombination-promoting nuclease/putative transposase [Clostridia bacterium]|nr:Rpn family recombination-promoting nuclease/putative transposase [Clostridia bacterium]
MLTEKKKFKDFSELTFTDDFMFCKVLQANPEITKKLAELVTGVRIGGILKLNSQEEIRISPDGKGVRFDVYAEDDANRILDIEMQTVTRRDLPRRSRYYQSTIDSAAIEKGEPYEKLRDSYVVFILLSDSFGYGGYRYRFETWCREYGGFAMDDGIHKIFLNADGNHLDATPEMQAFLSYLKDGEPGDEFTESIEIQVRNNRRNQEMNREYYMMKLFEHDAKEEGRAEGRAEQTKNLGDLFLRLKQDNRLDDYEQALANPDYLNLLMAEYQIGTASA